MNDHFDVVIIGSGFSGSILARVLATRGRRVLLLDRVSHPRFAIGESTTPIADLLLRRIGQQYGLDDLVNLSAYGRWQRSLPELACGLKRGFSYFDHRESIRETCTGQRSLIVAASPDDERGDTHWYRSEVDEYLFRQSIVEGVDAREGISVTGLDVSTPARVRLDSGEVVTTDFVVDASGAAQVASRCAGTKSLRDRLRTQTCCVYAHFRGVNSFSDVFNWIHNDDRACVPFDADAAAQHHLVDEGWAWMLRLNNGVTSVGITSPLDSCSPTPADVLRKSKALLKSRFDRYHELHRIMDQANVIAPSTGIVSVARIQRLLDPVLSSNCLMMPTTAVSIDPLHSTGIAHALAGVIRIADIVINGPDQNAINRYRESVLAEAEHLDRLVAMAYDAIVSFPRFTAACMVYFAAAIACEERIGVGESPGKLWQADDDRFVSATRDCAEWIQSSASDQNVVDQIRQRIEPWNNAGLFDSAENRYAYTATK